MSELRGVLASKYGSYEQQVDQVIDLYSSLYRLPVLEREFKVGLEFYARCSKISRMVVVVLHDTLKNVLMIESQSRFDEYTFLGDRLIGAAFSPRRGDRVEEVVRWAVQAQVGTELAELRPLAVVINHYSANGHRTTHRGLAFLAAATEPLTPYHQPHKGMKISQQLPKEMAFQNKEILSLAFDALSAKYFPPPIAEIQEANRHRLGKWLHRYAFSWFLRPLASSRLRKRILRHIDEGQSIVDVSAGTDNLIMEIYDSKSPNLCVVNDISWQAMDGLRRRARSTASNIIFTNHNVADIPFIEPFDIVLFKNTLHHLRSEAECLAVLERLGLLGRKILICDIEEPRKSWRGRLFNLYYEYIVGDGDRNNIFFDYASFQSLIRNFFDDRTVSFDRIWTIRGDYMCAYVHPRVENNETEGRPNEGH